MTTQAIYDHFATLTLRQQADIIANLRDMRREKFNETYIVVEVVNGSANISHLIRDITGFDCYHTPGSCEGTCGYNNILIPRELHTNELDTALVKFFSGMSSKFVKAEWDEILHGIINA